MENRCFRCGKNTSNVFCSACTEQLKKEGIVSGGSEKNTMGIKVSGNGLQSEDGGVSITSIRALDLKKGDIVVLRLGSNYCPPEIISKYYDRLKGCFPDGIRVLILNRNDSIEVFRIGEK